MRSVELETIVVGRWNRPAPQCGDSVAGSQRWQRHKDLSAAHPMLGPRHFHTRGVACGLRRQSDLGRALPTHVAYQFDFFFLDGWHTQSSATWAIQLPSDRKKEPAAVQHNNNKYIYNSSQQRRSIRSGLSPQQTQAKCELAREVREHLRLIANACVFRWSATPFNGGIPQPGKHHCHARNPLIIVHPVSRFMPAQRAPNTRAGLSKPTCLLTSLQHSVCTFQNNLSRGKPRLGK